ncbi:MAG: hypothetical protein U1A27_00035 [Phycisphaerae bacterium]
MSTLATRSAIIRFVRLHPMGAGLRARLHWNGRLAANGDGLPPLGGSAVVDYAAPLAGPVAVIPSGKHGFAAGGYAEGDAAIGSPEGGAPLGWAEGPYAIGEYAQPLGYCEIAVPLTLRDGAYTIGVALMDMAGNVAAGQEIAVSVAALPRPAARARAESVSAGLLRLAWDESPDLRLE